MNLKTEEKVREIFKNLYVKRSELNVKLWIIYHNGISFSKLIAGMLQDRWEDYIDVDVGKAKKIDPVYLVEEKLDFLIIGDIINKEIPSLEIQNWLLKYGEISNQKKFTLKAVSGFYVVLPENKVEPFWVEFLQDNVPAEIVFPPILKLKLNLADISLERTTPGLVKKYSNDFIEFIINNKKSGVKKIFQGVNKKDGIIK